jgi:site-specific recombinase XerD
VPPKVKSWIDPAVEKVWRENRCLGDASIVMYRECVQRFVDYCKVERLSPDSELTLTGAANFAKWYASRNGTNPRYAFETARSALGTWAFARKSLGEPLPPWQAAASDPLKLLPPLLQEFAEHSRQHRGNPANTIHKKTQHVMKFLAFLRRRRRHLGQLKLSDIDAFVMHLRPKYSRSVVADVCSSLRAFTRFLRTTGRLSADLASSILAPVIRKLERPHRSLPWRDVTRILRAIDRGSPCGRRDYALLLMMSVYGLGAGEIIRLQLDDVAWRAGTIRVVRPKTGVEFMLPLLPAVARALVSYLRHGRPAHASSRNLFVTMRAPHKQLACSVTIRHILHTHARNAGVSAPFLGTHVLRHTHACRHIELGTKPKIVSDILGHRDPESTSAYIRIATGRLRDIALPVPS